MTPDDADLCATLTSRAVYDRQAEWDGDAVLCEQAAARIEALADEVERLTADESASNKTLVHANILAGQRADRAEADAERFVWWFSDEPKGAIVAEYLRGVREHWSLDQWRAAIDAAAKEGTK